MHKCFQSYPDFYIPADFDEIFFLLYEQNGKNESYG